MSYIYIQCMYPLMFAIEIFDVHYPLNTLEQFMRHEQKYKGHYMF